jgi:malate dehydrogenase (oxaloacetate-decarboxylating)
MKLAAAHAIAETIGDDELHPDYIIPSVFDKRVAEAVAARVEDAAYARRRPAQPYNTGFSILVEGAVHSFVDLIQFLA